MALWQAILCGVFYYLNAGPWVCGIGFYTFGRPMVLGFFVGLILGDPITGTVVGATIQMIYLGLMSTGGSYPADSSLAGIVGTATAILTGLSAQEAVAIAVPIGLVGTIFYQLRMVSAVPFTHLADKYAAEGKADKIWIANVLLPQIILAAIYVIPCTMVCYFGIGAVQGLVNACEGTLPAIGIAMNMKAIFKGDARYFFFIGFLLVVYFNLNLIAVSCLAALMAIIYMQLKNDTSEEA